MRQRYIQNRRDSTLTFLNIYSPRVRRRMTCRPICELNYEVQSCLVRKVRMHNGCTFFDA